MPPEDLCCYYYLMAPICKYFRPNAADDFNFGVVLTNGPIRPTDGPTDGQSLLSH